MIVIFLALSGIANRIMPARQEMPRLSFGTVADPQGPRTPAQALKGPSGSHTFCDDIYRNICSKRGVTRDPTGVVRPDVDGELQALRAYEEIIHKHPDWSSEQVDEELVAQVYTPKRRERIESAYRWVQGAIERHIDSQPASVFTSIEKAQLKSRIRKTELQLPPPVSVYEDEPDLFTKNDVFYERLSDGKTRMRVGGAYILNAKSWFNLVFTVAHEFAHAIDPCELKNANLTIPAYKRISSCFLASGLIATPPGRHECGESDQLSETFADWMAVQVVSEALRSYAPELQGPHLINAATNSVRDLCEQEEGAELDLGQHPSPEIRIDRIFGQSPRVREILGCTQSEHNNYCGFDYQPPKKN